MEPKHPLTDKQIWQDALNPQLTRRRLRPLVRPGVIDFRMAEAIIGRWQRLSNRLPLLAQLEQRWSGVRDLPAGQVPIVYAEPLTSSAGGATGSSSDSPGTQPTGTPAVQAKFAAGISGGPEMPVVAATAMPATGTAENSPMPVVRAKLEPEAERLPAISAENSPMPVVRAKQEPETGIVPVISAENSPMPVVRAKLEPEAERLPAISAENSPMPVVRAKSEPEAAILPAISVENSPMPVVRAKSEPEVAILPAISAENSPMPVVRAKQEPDTGLLPAISAENSPMPVVRAKQEPEAGILPAISGESLPLPVVRAKLEPEAGILPAISGENSPKPVVRAKQEPEAGILPAISGENSPMPVVRAKLEPEAERLPAISGENSPMPVVRATAGLRPWLAQQPDPLLATPGSRVPTTLAASASRQFESLQPLNPSGTVAVTPERRTAKLPPVMAKETATGWTGAGVPLVLPVAPSVAGQAREASSSSVTAGDRKTPAAQQTAAGARSPAVTGSQTEGKVAPETETAAKIDVEALADKIERKLMRRLMVESERRGQMRWR